MNSPDRIPSADPIADLEHAPAALGDAWKWHLARPEAAYARAQQAYDEARAADDARSLAWAALCRALAGYRWIGHDIATLNDPYMDFGSGQFAWRLQEEGRHTGYIAASDARKDGHAAGV